MHEMFEMALNITHKMRLERANSAINSMAHAAEGTYPPLVFNFLTYFKIWHKYNGDNVTNWAATLVTNSTTILPNGHMSI